MLGSGSRGNALVVSCGPTHVLIDCGFSIRETERRLARLGLGTEALAAIVLTHEDDDHASGAPALARRHRIPLWLTHLPEDRKTQGLVLDHSIRDNYALPSLNRLSVMGLVQHRRIDTEAQEYMGRLSIKAPDMFTFTIQLSGGNQQKAVVAKWLGAQARVLIFDEPPRGIY